MRIKAKSLITFFIIVSVLFSCRSIKTSDVSGVYIIESCAICSGKLSLQPSGRFFLDYYVSMAPFKSEGEWLLRDGYLVLKSDPSFKTGNLIVEERKEAQSYIQLFDETGPLFENISIQINGDKMYSTDKNGRVNLNEKVENITVMYIMLKDLKDNYQVKDKDANVFIIKTVDFDPQKYYFDNYRSKMRNRKVSILRLEYIKQ